MASQDSGSSPAVGSGTGPQSLDETAGQMERVCNDPNSAETLFALARPRLLRLVEIRMPARLVRRVDAEDVVQETLAVAARRFDQYLKHRKVPVFVWLRGLAIERLIELKRRHMGAAKRAVSREVATREWLNESSCNLLERWATDTRSPSGVIADRERGNDLKRALLELPQNYRDVLTLRFFDALTIAETAAALNCSIANAKVLQFRALKKLESIISENLGWQTVDRQP